MSRILLLLALSLSSFLSFSQKGYLNSIRAAAPIIGEIYNESFTNLDNWTVTGTNDYTASPNGLTVSGANVSDYSKCITRNNSEFNYRQNNLKVRFKVMDISPTMGGFAVGFKSVNTSVQATHLLEINTQSSVINPFITTRGFSNSKTAWSGASNLSCAINDVVEATMSLYFNSLSLTIRNITGGTSATYTTPINGYPNTSVLSFYSLGGTTSDVSITLSSDFVVGSEILFMGNSITVGFQAGLQTNQFSYLVGKKYLNYATCAGSGDKTSEALLALPNILKLKPKIVVIELGTNDYGFGVSANTFITNLISIRNQLIAAGAKVYVCKILPRNNSGIDAYNTKIDENIPSQYIIDTYYPMKGAGIELNPIYDSGDGIHPNAAGNIKIAEILELQISITPIQNYNNFKTIDLQMAA